MKKYLVLALCLLMVTIGYAQNYTEYFADKTLRVDYIFTGDASRQNVCLDELSVLPSWAGRRHHLAGLPLQGNGQIIMKVWKVERQSIRLLFLLSFKSGWKRTSQSCHQRFENTFLLPYPLRPVEIEITLLSPRKEDAHASDAHCTPGWIYLFIRKELYISLQLNIC